MIFITKVESKPEWRVCPEELEHGETCFNPLMSLNFEKWQNSKKGTFYKGGE